MKCRPLARCIELFLLTSVLMMGLWACDGGSSTDTPNGITSPNDRDSRIVVVVLDDTGRAVGDAKVEVVEISYDDMESDSLYDEGQSGVDGSVELMLADTGSFIIRVTRDETMTKFLYLMAFSQSDGDTIVLAQGQQTRFSGKLVRQSGIGLDSARLRIKGTDLATTADSTGFFDFGAIPSTEAMLVVETFEKPLAIVSVDSSLPCFNSCPDSMSNKASLAQMKIDSVLGASALGYDSLNRRNFVPVLAADSLSSRVILYPSYRPIPENDPVLIDGNCLQLESDGSTTFRLRMDFTSALSEFLVIEDYLVSANCANGRLGSTGAVP